MILLELILEIDIFLRRRILSGYLRMDKSFLFIEVINVVEFLFEDNEVLFQLLFLDILV